MNAAAWECWGAFRASRRATPFPTGFRDSPRGTLRIRQLSPELICQLNQMAALRASRRWRIRAHSPAGTRSPWRSRRADGWCERSRTPPCRHDHRAKQAPGWTLTQPSPHMTWTTPSGRTYTTGPTCYPD